MVTLPGAGSLSDKRCMLSADSSYRLKYKNEKNKINPLIQEYASKHLVLYSIKVSKL